MNKTQNMQYLYIIVFFTILPLLGISQNQWQDINYKGVSVKIPIDWGNKNTINYYEEANLTVHQISAWAKDSTYKTFIVQWLDDEIKSTAFIESIVLMLKSQFDLFNQQQFDSIVDIDYHGIKAKKCSFYDNPNKKK